LDLSDPTRIAFPLIEKLPNSVRVNKTIRKIRKVFPIIFKSVFRALAVNSRIFAG
jgi:hypothetical protein